MIRITSAQLAESGTLETIVISKLRADKPDGLKSLLAPLGISDVKNYFRGIIHPHRYPK